MPISATVVSADALASRQIFDPSQLQLVAPSLQVKSFNAALGASNFSIRGVGTLSFSELDRASVTSVIDGVVMGNPSLGFMNYLDLAQIEVLHGPQGMLFGKNASAGLVNITTRRPEIGRFDGQVMGEIAQMKVPGDGLLLSSARHRQRSAGRQGRAARQRVTHTDPVITNLVDAFRAANMARTRPTCASVLWEPTAELSIYIAGDHAAFLGRRIGRQRRPARPAHEPLRRRKRRTRHRRQPRQFLLRLWRADSRPISDVGGLQANIDYEFEAVTR